MPENINKMLYSVINKVSSCVSVYKVYLYGSYYNGTNTKDSDLDIAFFLNDNESLLDAHRRIIKITSKYPIDIQPQIFCKCELEDNIGIVGEILENGGEIIIERNTE